MRIEGILGVKGTAVVTIRPDATVRDAVGALAQHRLGALVVSADGAHADGIVSERDIVRHLDRDQDGLLDLAVRDIMSTPVLTCRPEDEVETIMQTMTDERVRHLPVVSDGAVIGIVSIGDVVKATIEKLQNDRKLLEEYIGAR
jgi:CBS domain-containing protein